MADSIGKTSISHTPDHMARLIGGTRFALGYRLTFAAMETAK